MRTHTFSRIVQLIAVSLLALALCASQAGAYVTHKGSGAASGTISHLGTSTISGATAAAGGTVSLSWSAVTTPGAGSVAYYVRRDGGAAAGNCPAAGAPTNVTSCTDSGLTPGSHVYTITALWRSWTSKSAERTVNVTVGAADHLVLSLSDTTPAAGASDSLTITAKDSAGNTVTTYTGSKSLTFGGANSIGANHPTVTNSSGSAVAFGTAETLTFSGGIATVSSGRNGAAVFYKAETTAITVTDGTLSNGAGTTITTGPASTSSFTLTTPTGVTAGVPFNDTLSAFDQYGNPTPSYTGPKSLTFKGPSTSPNGKSSPSYPGTVSFSAGVGTASITLYDAQTTTLSASQSFPTVSGSTSSFTVSPAAVSALAVASPGTQTAGVAFSATLSAVDAYGNTQPSYEGTRSLTFSEPDASPSGKAPEYPASVNFTAGTGKAAITLYDAQTTPLAVSDGILSGTSSNFTVGAAPTSSLTLSTPAPTAGSAFSETLTAKDIYGNPSLNGAKSVSFSGPSASPSGKAPSYPSSVSFSSSGVGSASITLYDVQTTTLTATIGSASGTSAGFTVKAAATGTFSVSTPSAQVAGTPFNVTLTATDTFGNPLGLEGTQTIAFTGPATSPSGKAPAYPASVSFTAGTGTATVTLYSAAGSVALTATQGSLKGSSGNFTVAAATAAQLAWTNISQLSTGEEEGLCLFTCTWSGIGRSHTWKANVSVTDGYGNVVSNVGAGHTISWTPAPAAGSVSPSSLTLPSTGAATTTSQVTYTSPNSNSWTTDTLTAHSAGFADATVLFKK
jgi:hypothetical protein